MSLNQAKPPFATAFSIPLSFGTLLAAWIPKEISVAASPKFVSRQEQDYAVNLQASKARKCEWLAGRVALRRASILNQTPIDDDFFIKTTKSGAPLLPSHLCGSLSHKNQLAVALVSNEKTISIGVDIEKATGLKTNIASRVLSKTEQGAFSKRSFDSVAAKSSFLLRHFSAKEAVYKALGPALGAENRIDARFHDISLTFSPAKDLSPNDAILANNTGIWRIETTWTVDAAWDRPDFASYPKPRLCCYRLQRQTDPSEKLLLSACKVQVSNSP